MISRWQSLSSSFCIHTRRYVSTSPTVSTPLKYKPDLVLFSETVLLPLRHPPGEIFSKIAKDYNLDVPPQVIQTAWLKVLQNHQKSKPLYNNNSPVTEKEYEKWYLEAITKTLDLFRQFGSNLTDDLHFSKLRHRIYLNLTNPRSYYIPTDVMALLDRLRAEQIPYGVVANSGPHFKKLLRQVDSRIKHDSYLTVSKKHGGHHSTTLAQRKAFPLIPFINAADIGIGKPNTAIFMRLLKQLNPDNPDNVYYIGDNPEIDYAPSKSVGLKSVLVTRHFDNPVSDVKYLTAKKCRLLPYMRVAKIGELDKVLFEKRSFAPGVVTRYLPDVGTKKEGTSEKTSRVREPVKSSGVQVTESEVVNNS